MTITLTNQLAELGPGLVGDIDIQATTGMCLKLQVELLRYLKENDSTVNENALGQRLIYAARSIIGSFGFDATNIESWLIASDEDLPTVWVEGEVTWGADHTIPPEAAATITRAGLRMDRWQKDSVPVWYEESHKLYANGRLVWSAKTRRATVSASRRRLCTPFMTPAGRPTSRTL